MTSPSTRCTERRGWRRAAALAGGVLLAAGTAAAGAAERSTPARSDPHAGHRPAAGATYVRSLVRYRLPAVTLVDMDGGELPLAAALGHDGPLFLQFIFTTCPGVCPALAAIFSASQRELGDELAGVRLVSISIDPEHDTPERLRAYARRFDAAPQWRFLTGDLEAVEAVQKAFGAYRGNKMRHEPTIYLRPSPGAPWLRIDGFLTAAELVAEYRSLAAAADHRAGAAGAAEPPPARP